MFKFEENEGKLTRVSHVSIFPISTRHFCCLSHKEKQQEQTGSDALPSSQYMTQPFMNSKGETLTFEKRNDIQESDTSESENEEGDEKEKAASSVAGA